MAKSAFTRTKPHANVATAPSTTARLHRLGMSLQGAGQALNGEPVMNPSDRLRLARILGAGPIEPVTLNFAKVEPTVYPSKP